MARLKITGYIDIDEIDEEYVDLDHASGLTEEGYLVLIVGEEGPEQALSLSGLDDLDTEIER